MGLVSQLKRAVNAIASNVFVTNDPYREPSYSGTPSYGGARPDQTRLRYFNERSLITAILVRMAVDVSGIELRHVKLNEFGRYLGDADSKLNEALKIETNMDQSPRAFRQDMALSLFDLGSIAVVPIDVLTDPTTGEIVDILTLRVGHIVGWRHRHIQISVFNEERQTRETLWVEKKRAAIVENPFLAVMNSSSSTLQRLIQKLNLLDAVDQQSASGKLDLIIQLPYTIKTDAKRQEADKRRKEIEDQLTGSRYGIAYADGTEKIVQLNRPVENNLLDQVDRLTKMLYGQMGVTEDIMNGTADAAAMLNYFDRSIEPVIDAIAEAMRRTFIGRKKDEDISYFRNPFKLVPLSELAEVVDKLARNEVFSANEIRGYIGVEPSTDPKADKLQNSNMPQPPVGGPATGLPSEGVPT